jgi:hypothetical protein
MNGGYITVVYVGCWYNIYALDREMYGSVQIKCCPERKVFK